LEIFVHQLGELFSSTAGSVVVKAFRASGQDMIAGLIDYQCPTLAVAISQIESKTVKTFAILTKNRSTILPVMAFAH
jgi:hypothetical protein